MKRSLYILLILLLILILAVGGCRKAGTWLVKKDTIEHADVMVMLTGSFADRVLQTADLHNEGVAGKVWIVEPGNKSASLLEERGVKLISEITKIDTALISLGVPANSIVYLPGGATSTMMEAEIVRDYLFTQHRIDTLLLVSSPEHMRRAYKLFKAATDPIRASRDEPITICCMPSKYSDFNAEKWWRSRDDIQDVVKEYLKLVNFALFEKRELRKGK